MEQNKKDFGFGCMRLPTLRQDDPTSFDYEKINALFDAFLAQGFTYFDTAYTYHGSATSLRRNQQSVNVTSTIQLLLLMSRVCRFVN